MRVADLDLLQLLQKLWVFLAFADDIGRGVTLQVQDLAREIHVHTSGLNKYAIIIERVARKQLNLPHIITLSRPSHLHLGLRGLAEPFSAENDSSIQIYNYCETSEMRQNQQTHPNFKEAQTTVEFLLGPIKIKDGLFMGDQLAARDIEFIVTNKVTHIINTVSKAVPNLYQRFGVQYLSVHWTEREENIFDKKNNALSAIFSFVQEAMEQGESCLIHSLHGKSRACAVLAAYLMRKYSWSLNKSLELINTKKEGLQIRSNYLSQMQELEARLAETTKLSYSWSEVKSEEDELLSNTFSNSKKAQKIEPTLAKRQNIRKVTWDEKPAQKYTPASSSTNSMAITMNRFSKPDKRETSRIKSILKGFPNEDEAFRPEIKEKTLLDNGSNVVAVTINNFMQTQKKQEQTSQMHNARPFSSDNKDREKKTNPYDLKPSKLFAYDNSITTNIKAAYDNKIVGKLGVTTGGSIGKNIKKGQDVRRGVLGNDRPLSANIVPDRKKAKNVYSGYSGQDLIVTNNIGKKRFPSTNPREDILRLK